MKTLTIVFCDTEKSKDIIKILREEEKDEYTYSIFENRVEIETTPISEFIRKDKRELFSGFSYLEYSWMDVETWLRMKDSRNNLNVSGEFSFQNFYEVSKTMMFTEEFSEKLLNLENPSCPIVFEQFVSEKEKMRKSFLEEISNKNISEDEW
jgi:hypothetical protein